MNKFEKWIIMGKNVLKLLEHNIEITNNSWDDYEIKIKKIKENKANKLIEEMEI